MFMKLYCVNFLIRHENLYISPCMHFFFFFFEEPVSEMILGWSFPCFVCVVVLLPSQPIGVMLSVVCLPNHTFTGQA